MALADKRAFMYRRPTLSSQAPQAFLQLSWAHSSFLAILLCTAACGGAGPVVDTGPLDIVPAELQPMEDPRSPIAMLGTLNAGHLGGGYDLSVVEYVIRAFEPDTVLVELPPEEFEAALAESDRFDGDVVDRSVIGNNWLMNLPELYEVVLPLRHQLGFDVVPVSAWSEYALEDQAAFEAAHPHGPMERWYVLSNAALQAAMLDNNGARDPHWLHGAEFLELITAASRWLAYYSEEDMGDAGELRLHAGHARLIAPALDERPGQRVLIIFAVTSRWYLEPLLRNRDDFRFQPISAFLPPPR